MIALPPMMFLDEPRAPFRITAWTPACRLDENFHTPSLRHAQQTELEKAAELPHPRIVLRAAHLAANRQPDLIACGRAIDPLRYEF
jgi:hypothetical protein